LAFSFFIIMTEELSQQSSTADATNAPFREVQRPRQYWLKALVYALGFFAWYALAQQIIFDKPIGDNSVPDAVIWLIWLLVGLALPLLFYRSRLIVEVRSDHLFISYIPFARRSIHCSEIVDFQARSYHPIKEYGGWGVRRMPGNKRAYNISGDQGVELELADGQTIMIGSQRPEDLARALNNACRQPVQTSGAAEL